MDDPRWKPEPTAAEQLERSWTDGPSGIRGWLLFFVVSQVLTLLILGFAALDLPGFLDAWGARSESALYRPFLLLETVAQIGILVATVVGLHKIFTREPDTPRYYQYYFVGVMLFGLFEFAGVQITFGGLEAGALAAGVTEADWRANKLRAASGALRSIGYAAVWILYWRKSVRVANTFAPAAPAAPQVV